MPRLRVLTYNVRYFGHATRGIASTAAAMKRIADAMASLDPLCDMICLQEVDTQSIRSNVAHPANGDETQLERLMEMLHAALARAGKPDEYEAYYFPAHSYRVSTIKPIYTTGLAVIAHRDFRVAHHNAAMPADITHRNVSQIRRLKQTRICAHVRFAHRSGDDVDIFNTHLSLPTALSRAFWTEAKRMGYGPNQLEEAKNLARFVSREKKSDRFLIVGDFNALPGSPVYRHLVQECGFEDPFATLHKMTEDELDAWPTAGFMNLRMHIDHVFCGKGLTFVDFDETQPFGDHDSVFRGLSDHMPLIGSCRVRDDS